MNKVIFVAPHEDSIGGISNWFRVVKNYCNSKSIEIFTIYKSSKKSESLKSSFFEKYLFSYFRIYSQKRKIKEAAKKEFNVIHIASSCGNGFIRDFHLLKTAKKLKLKTILHLHSESVSRFTDKKNSLEKKYFEKLLKYVDEFVAIDERTYKYLSQRKIPSSLIVNPIEVNSYCFDLSKHTAIFVGHVIKEKGIEELVKAFTKFSQNNDWQLKIIGPLGKGIKFDILLKNIEICGPMSHEETLKQIKKSSVLVLPSYTEGLPYVLLEAMSFGIPCIATNVGEIPNLLNGCGLIIKPKSDQEIFEALEKISDDNFRLVTSKEAFKRINDNYSAEIVCNKYLTLWNK